MSCVAQICLDTLKVQTSSQQSQQSVNSFITTAVVSIYGIGFPVKIQRLPRRSVLAHVRTRGELWN